MVQLGDIWFECDDVKIIQIKLKHLCISDTVNKLILQKKHMMETFNGHWAGPNGCLCWVKWGEGIETQQVPLKKISQLLTFIHLCYLFYSLTFCLLLLLMSPDVDLVLFFWTYIWDIQWCQSTYVYRGDCYLVIIALYVRIVVVSLHTISLLMTILNAQ